MLEVDKLLAAISDAAPSGPNLEYDPLFASIEKATQGKPERRMGDTVIAAEEPDWREVRSKSIELFSRTKDLRLGVFLTKALLHTEGFLGLGDGLALLHGFVDLYWESVHPQLDPEDGLDPTMRINTLVSLCHADGMLRAVREAPLVRTRLNVTFCLRDILIATGKLPVPSGASAPPDIASINAAFDDCDLDQLQTTADAIGKSIAHVEGIESLVTEKVGAARAASFAELAGLLKSGQRTLAERLARRGVVVEGVQNESADTASSPGAMGRPFTGDITTRDDAIRVLEKVCDYFAQHEPSSPVPILLRRAKRLVSKNFMEIVRDLAPDGLPQVENIKGAGGEES